MYHEQAHITAMKGLLFHFTTYLEIFELNKEIDSRLG